MFFLTSLFLGNDGCLPFFHVGDGVVVLLHPGEDAVPGLGDAEIGLIELYLVVGLLDLQFADLFLEQLSLEFLAVHAQLVLCVGQFVEQFLHGRLLAVVLVDEVGVLADEPLVLSALVGVELVEAQFHLFMDVLKFVLHALRALLHLLALQEDLVQLELQLFVVVLHVLVGVLDVLGTRVGAQLVQRKVVVRQLALQLPHFVVQLLQARLQFVVELLFLADLLGLRL